MLRSRKADFDREICMSVVHLDKKTCIVTDEMLHEKGKRCFDLALELLRYSYPYAVQIKKEEFGRYKKVFAVRGFAGRGTEIKMRQGNSETVKAYCILQGVEIYQKIKNSWVTKELGQVKKYNDNDGIPKVSFHYAPTDSKYDDAYFDNPLAEYVEYFGVNN